MKRVYKKALALAEAAPVKFKGGVRFQWDNAPIHKTAERQLGYNFNKIPPYSPDFNKVVEHRFGTIKREFQKRVFTDLSIRNYTTAAKLLRKVVEDVVTPNAVFADACTVKKTLEAVYRADGGWPPAHLA